MGEKTIEIRYEPGLELLPPEVTTRTGDENKGLKIVSTEWKGKVVAVTVDGLASESYVLKVMNEHTIADVKGANLNGNAIEFPMPNDPAGEFVRKTIEIRVK
jgi:hypothetical protein